MAYLEFRPTGTLYQYCSSEGFLGIVKSKTLRCTDLAAANDPRELKLGYDHFVEAIRFVRDHEKSLKLSASMSAVIHKIVAAHEVQRFFCACFTQAGDSLPMWREYGRDGLCIGFRPSAITSLPGRIQRVNYLNAETVGDFRQLARETLKEVSRAPDEFEQIVLSTAILAAMTALKHDTWSHEKEVRFVFSQVRKDPGRIPVSWQDEGQLIYWQTPLSRDRSGILVEYLEFPFGLRRGNTVDPRRAIATVLIGPGCTMTVEEVRSELDRNNFEEVVVAKSACQIRN